jgi:anthranilate synthase/aminodeoxychorismate synthase-like glutamine amidotransferase
VILLIDNYDSFTFNLAQYFGELGAPPVVAATTRLRSTTSKSSTPLTSSSRPDRDVRRTRRSRSNDSPVRPSTPLLGVCLGHQGIGIAFGGEVIRAPQLMHGKTSSVQHDGRGVFRGVSQPFVAGRYHSLIVGDPLPDALEPRANRRRHDHGRAAPEFPIHGVQFHPESVLTGEGQAAAAQLPGDGACSPRCSRSCSAARTSRRRKRRQR